MSLGALELAVGMVERRIYSQQTGAALAFESKSALLNEWCAPNSISFTSFGPLDATAEASVGRLSCPVHEQAGRLPDRQLTLFGPRVLEGA